MEIFFNNNVVRKPVTAVMPEAGSDVWGRATHQSLSLHPAAMQIWDAAEVS